MTRPTVGEERSRNDRDVARGIRADLIIAALALLVSAGAMAAMLVQTHVIATQLSASVWPYLSVTNNVGRHSLEIDVDNDGLGPALIRSVSLQVMGRTVRRLRDFNRALFPRLPKHASAQEYFNSLGTGNVIRAGDSFQLVRLQTSFALQGAIGATSRYDLKVCYCSIVQTCWMLDSQSNGFPTVTGSCPARPTVLLY